MSATDPAAKKSRYLLTDWNPNDESKWDSKLAWRTLWIVPLAALVFALSCVGAALDEEKRKRPPRKRDGRRK